MNTGLCFYFYWISLEGRTQLLCFDDVDIDEIVPTMARSGFINQGEICLCMSRIFVQAPIFDKFVAKYVEAAK